MATVIWAVVVGFAARVAIAVAAPAIGGASFMRWLVGTPLGLALGAAFIQCALFGMAMLRSTLMIELRSGLLQAMRLRPSRWFTAVAFVIGLAPLANVTGILIAKLLRADLDSIEFIGMLVRRASWTELLVMAFALTVLPAIVEESIFRGLVLGSLDELRPMFALVISAGAFGAFHLDVAQGIATMILGLGFGFIVQTTGSLVGAMVAHGMYNLIVLLTQRYLPLTETPIKWQLVELSVGLGIALLAGWRLERVRFRATWAKTEGTA